MVGPLLVLALAGAPAALQIGRTVRVEFVEETGREVKVEGRLVGLAGDALIMSSSDQAREIPWTAVRHIQRRRQERKTTILRGAGLGLLAGAVLGATVGGISNGRSACSVVCFSDSQAAAATGLGLGVVGAAAGGIIGATVPARWDQAIPAPIGLQVRLRF
jgi:hypothetical protein